MARARVRVSPLGSLLELFPFFTGRTNYTKCRETLVSQTEEKTERYVRWCCTETSERQLISWYLWSTCRLADMSPMYIRRLTKKNNKPNLTSERNIYTNFWPPGVSSHLIFVKCLQMTPGESSGWSAVNFAHFRCSISPEANNKRLVKLEKYEPCQQALLPSNVGIHNSQLDRPFLQFVIEVVSYVFARCKGSRFNVTTMSTTLKYYEYDWTQFTSWNVRWVHSWGSSF